MVAPTLVSLEPRLFNKMAVLIDIETTEGEDAQPTTAEAMIFSNVTFRPMVATRVQRNLVLPNQGNQGVILTGLNAQIEFDVELAGSGVAGTPPKWGTLMRIGSFNEIITATTSVEYRRIDANREHASVYVVLDGVRHILLGCSAALKATINSLGIPQLHGTITGLWGLISDQPNPVVAKTGWLTPEPVSPEVTQMKLHGWQAVAESLEIDFGNQVVTRFLIGSKSVPITNYSATGTAVVQATDIATVDWFTKAKFRERGVLDFTHGVAAGNTINIKSQFVETGEPTIGQTDNIINYSLGLDICTDGSPEDIVMMLT
ncbi:phage tail tube protein [Rhizobium sp. 11_C7_N12_5]|uniref:phage tail tube protein n=1 Tax=Rhizobium sp. 11_C7_N12_5 TaxID=3240770 RepID=UPI003F21D963